MQVGEVRGVGPAAADLRRQRSPQKLPSLKARRVCVSAALNRPRSTAHSASFIGGSFCRRSSREKSRAGGNRRGPRRPACAPAQTSSEGGASIGIHAAACRA